MSNIVFIGDSYCSSSCDNLIYDPDNGQQGNHNTSFDDLSSWLDRSSRQLGLDLYSFGYAGRSWYYSRSRWLGYAKDNPGFLEQTAVIVFCHTDPYRYNTGNGTVSNSMLDPGYQSADPTQQRAHRELAQSLRSWAADLIDYPYQCWAQEQWFYEIARILAPYPAIKQIHFQCFPFVCTDPLPGMVYTTPLIHLSLAELTGTRAEIQQAFERDQRVNHLNRQNNHALAQIVIDSVNNYNPGKYTVNTAGFDFNNPGAVNWPDGVWWTN